MTQRDARGYLADILSAARTLQEHVAGRAFEDFERSTLLRDAVERRFAIIGEALNRATQLDRALSGRVTDARQVIAFRNRLIHVYADVDPRVVWDAIHDHLPRLVLEIEALLEEADRHP